MANNIFIAYDLNSPGQDYSEVIEAIKSLGVWAKIQESLWFVSTTLSEKEVFNHIGKVMDDNDSLIIINTKTNGASWSDDIEKNVGDYIRDNWSR
jgi:hypothetical protein